MTGFDRYLSEQMKNSEFAAAFDAATSELNDDGWVEEWTDVQFTTCDPDRTVEIPAENLAILRGRCRGPHPRTVRRQ